MSGRGTRWRRGTLDAQDDDTQRKRFVVEAIPASEYRTSERVWKQISLDSDLEAAKSKMKLWKSFDKHCEMEFIYRIKECQMASEANN